MIQKFPTEVVDSVRTTLGGNPTIQQFIPDQLQLRDKINEIIDAIHAIEKAFNMKTRE